MTFPINSMPPSKIGLALGSGSARGWAHIGVIKALAESGIRIDCVAGTSIGAVVGAAFAAGELDTLTNIAEQMDWQKILSFFDIIFPKSGLLDGKAVMDFARSRVKQQQVEQFSIPFAAVCTDLSTGREVVLRTGDMIDVVRASSSVPGIMTPVKKDGAILVDGGLVNPVPVNVVREMGAEFVIAVDLNHDIVGKKGIHKRTDFSSDPADLETEPKNQNGYMQNLLEAINQRLGAAGWPGKSRIHQWRTKESLPNIFEVLMSSINIMECQVTASRLMADKPDLLIQPKLGHIRFLEFHRAEEAIKEGYQATLDNLWPLKKEDWHAGS